MTISDVKFAKSFVFMKVGFHGEETLKKIIDRKRDELRAAGFSLWGYGGSACHPTKQVQPFLKQVKQNGEVPWLLMQITKSDHRGKANKAEEYSLDKNNWKTIPDGIIVTGSKYALVLDDIQPYSFDINLNEYQVGIGPSFGKPAHSYLQGQQDKACLNRSVQTPIQSDSTQSKSIAFVARMKEPYAVFVR